jgi:hypothetical protein
LTLLDAMERRASDPDELGDLYRLDHLTTRMRRHAEGLIILSGAAPGRAWRNPVRLVDVLRAAVAEVEDYTRVTVVTMTQAALAGPVVADVIHMIAELVENSTVFSPPNTPVRLTGDMVARGFAVEIEDRGLGLNEEKLAEINDRLANPPEFDLSDSDQLGLFVAGRLAKRHDIKIAMRLNPYGGTTAIVLIPRELVVSEDLFARDPSAALGSESTVQLTGRHASRSEDIIAAATPTGTHPYATNGLGAGFAEGAENRESGESKESKESGPGTGWAVYSPFTNITVAGLPDVPPATAPPATAPPATAPPATAPPATAPPATAPPATAPPATAPPATAPPASSTSWFHRASDNGWPERAEPAAVDAGDDAASTADLTEHGLPRRIRQASLAPQLREPAPQSSTGMDNEPGFRSPEEARATMTAIQRGWERGRSAVDGPQSEFGEPTSGEPGAGAPIDGGEE